MRALVTGAEGFIGHHICSLLADKGYEVYASVFSMDMAEDIAAKDVIRCDVRSIEDVNGAMAKSSPDAIYHLAAQSYPTLSWEKPQLTLDVNAIGTANVFESIIAHDLDPRVIVACSSAEYGMVSSDEVPVSEAHRLAPLHPYGVSKVAQDLLTYQYFRNNGIKGVRARIFNTTGPGKVKDVVSDFAMRVAECEAGKREFLTHGNLEARRDITDVRDMVRALWLCESATAGQAYNLCSMGAHKVADLLDRLLSLADGKVIAKEDPDLMRPTDEPIIMGDNTKFTKETGWHPEIGIEKTLSDTLDHFRKTV